MKKTLLLGSFAIFGLVANAQTLVTEVNSETLQAAGIESTKTDLPGGIVFGDGAAGTIATAYADSWGYSSNTHGTYQNVKVDDVEITLADGAVGNANPTFVNYASGVMEAGAVFEIVPSADGWLTVFTKMNPNKQYVAFEGKTTGMAYHLGYSNGETSIEYTLPFTEDYDIDFYADDAADYFVAAGGEGPEEVKPQFPWVVAGLEAAPSENTGFVTFNVLEGATYYFSALGSKATVGTFVLTEGDVPPVVTYLATDELPEVTFGRGFGELAGVEGIAADSYDVNAPVYNVMGQKVNADYKGIVIKNGKKFIQR